MSIARNVTLKKYAPKVAAILPFVLMPNVASADTDMTAGVIIEKMSGTEQASFFAGLVEGLAYARYQKDGQQVEGMRCIYGWYYDNEETIPAIVEAFKRFPDYTPGAVISAMIAKECGS